MKKAFVLMILSLLVLTSFVSAISVDIEIKDVQNKDYSCEATENYIRAWIDHICLTGKEVSLDLEEGEHYLTIQADDGVGVSEQGVAAKIIINGDEVIVTGTNWRNCYNSDYDYKCVANYTNLDYALLYPANSELILGADTIWSGESTNFVLVSYRFYVEAEEEEEDDDDDDDDDGMSKAQIRRMLDDQALEDFYANKKQVIRGTSEDFTPASVEKVSGSNFWLWFFLILAIILVVIILIVLALR